MARYPHDDFSLEIFTQVWGGHVTIYASTYSITLTDCIGKMWVQWEKRR